MIKTLKVKDFPHVKALITWVNTEHLRKESIQSIVHCDGRLQLLYWEAILD
jgi:hypothetical protein